MKSDPWNHYWEIAEALADAYPDADRLNISENDLLSMIRKIPEYKDIPMPKDKGLLKSVMMSWFNADEDVEPEERYASNA